MHLLFIYTYLFYLDLTIKYTQILDMKKILGVSVYIGYK